MKALAFLRKAGISGRMLNEYVYGGYLIWAAPERKVFIDGRADVYDSAGVLADYGRLFLLQRDPNVLLNKYRIDYCVLARGKTLDRILQVLPGWKEVYSDRQAVVFTRR